MAFEVSPSELNLKVGEYADISITLPDGTSDYDVIDIENVTEFNKTTKQLKALAVVENGIVTFNAGSETLNITVNITEANITASITETTEYENESSVTRGYFKEVRFIEDGKDYVAADHTNRPHEDILENLNVVASIEDIRGAHALGEWDQTLEYNTGDIVSFLSEYFISLQDTNVGNTPKLSSQKEDDEYWKPVCSAIDVSTVDYTTKLNTLKQTARYHRLINGRGFSEFSVSADTPYTIARMSNLLPFRDVITMYFEFSSGSEEDNQYPLVSYIEMEVLYTGLKYNSAGHFLPEISFGRCHCSVYDRDMTTIYSSSTPDSGIAYDEFGAYGIKVSASLRIDGLIGINVKTKYDGKVYISGQYRTTPFFEYEYGTIGGQARYEVNYPVRPFGGAKAYQDLGKVVAYNHPLSDKVIWDSGLINVMSAREYSASFLSLLAFKLGYWQNGNELRDVDSSVESLVPASYADFKYDRTISLPAMDATPTGCIMYVIGY